MGVGITAAVLGAAALGAGAQGCSAAESAKAQEAANQANLQGVRETNALRERLFHETRGSTGSSVLPEYQAAQEAAMSQDAINRYRALQAILGTPAQEVARYEALTGQMQPAFNAGTALVNQIYSGDLTRQRLAEAQPVETARSNVATANRAAIMQSLRQTLSKIQAQQAQAGYAGTGSTVQGAALRQTLGAQQAANAQSAEAALQNALGRQAIQEQGRQLALSSLDVPLARAQQAVQLATMPVTASAATQQALQNPFKFFYLGPGTAPPVSNYPSVSAVPSSAQIAATGMGSLATNLGNYYAQQQIAQELAKNQNAGLTLQDYIQRQRMIQESTPVTGSITPSYGAPAWGM